jgi:uncharacterized repeat protein (TIGR03803 family)
MRPVNGRQIGMSDHPCSFQKSAVSPAEASIMARVIRAAIVLACLGGCCASAYAQEDYQAIHVFPLPIEGPTTNLIRAPDGSFYGMTESTLYRITPQGEYVVVAQPGFAAYPIIWSYGIWATDGAMHFAGGLRVTVSGEVTRTHQFSGFAEFSPVIQASDGYLYGTTGRDGQFQRGTVYRMTVTGDDFTVLHNFTATEQPEFVPTGPITEGADGNFYINSPYAPIFECCGVIYKMTPDGTVSVFHTFTEGRTTWSPFFLARDGALYGLTTNSVYRLRDDGGLTILHQFDGDGNIFNSGYINQFSDGNFYFRFSEYVWRMTPFGAATALHHASTTGPEDVRYGTTLFDLVEGVDRNYYGVAYHGGGQFGQYANGVVFRLNATRSPCANVLEVLSDVDQNFYLTQFIKTETPALWGVWLVTASSIKPLWLKVTPAITPTVGFELDLYPFPKVGGVGVLSVLVTSHLNVCADWKTVDTGSGG